MTVSQALLFFDEASPEPYGAYGRALLDQGELFTRQVHLQMHETPTICPAVASGAASTVSGAMATTTASASAPTRTPGVLRSVATTSWDNFFVGAAGGWSKDKVDYALGNSDGESKSWQLGLYGGYRAGGFSADLQIAYINGSFDASRSINVATVVRDATASSDSNMWRAIGTVGYDL